MEFRKMVLRNLFQGSSRDANRENRLVDTVEKSSGNFLYDAECVTLCSVTT